jgi:hypothetical protein
MYYGANVMYNSSQHAASPDILLPPDPCTRDQMSSDVSAIDFHSINHLQSARRGRLENRITFPEAIEGRWPPIIR